MRATLTITCLALAAACGVQTADQSEGLVGAACVDITDCTGLGVTCIDGVCTDVACGAIDYDPYGPPNNCDPSVGPGSMCSEIDALRDCLRAQCEASCDTQCTEILTGNFWPCETAGDGSGSGSGSTGSRAEGFWSCDSTPCSDCGDGTCGAGETCSNCPVDCGPCPSCGDGTCDSGEDCSNCPADCGTCPPTGGTCAGQCGGAADGCYCDSVCDQYGDCCPDVCDECDLDFCGGDPGPTCGDGNIDPGEDCDTGNAANQCGCVDCDYPDIAAPGMGGFSTTGFLPPELDFVVATATAYITTLTSSAPTGQCQARRTYEVDGEVSVQTAQLSNLLPDGLSLGAFGLSDIGARVNGSAVIDRRMTPDCPDCSNQYCDATSRMGSCGGPTCDSYDVEADFDGWVEYNADICQIITDIGGLGGALETAGLSLPVAIFVKVTICPIISRISSALGRPLPQVAVRGTAEATVDADIDVGAGCCASGVSPTGTATVSAAGQLIGNVTNVAMPAIIGRAGSLSAEVQICHRQSATGSRSCDGTVSISPPSTSLYAAAGVSCNFSYVAYPFGPTVAYCRPAGAGRVEVGGSWVPSNLRGVWDTRVEIGDSGACPD